MKKLFLLIPALVLSLALSADVIYITPTSPHSSNNLRQALAAAATGDIIEMSAGTYVETGDWLAVDDKDVTVRAAAGAEVIIKPQFSVRIKAGTTNLVGKAEFIGVKFDCSALESSELVVPSANNANQSIYLNNCELYDWSANKALIHSTSSRKLDVISINNCYFHGFKKSIVFVENASLVSLSIINSTFENVTASINNDYYAAPIYVKATTGSVLVDHCTFYDVNSMSLSYGTVTVDNIVNPVVSNCIFMLTASADMCATNLKAGGDVKNCLTFNYDNWQPYGHYNTATVTDCVKANPLFKDAANGEFYLYASSPARGVGLEGSNLGDPRWAKALAPIAIPATLVPFDALLSTKASIIQSDPDSIFLKTESKEVIEWAKWNISVAESGLYDFTAYAKRTGSASDQKLQILVLNSAENDTLKNKSDNNVPNEGTISSGAVNLEAGNTYVIKVLNNYDWAKSKLIKVEAAYAGGKTIAIPDTLWPVDAIKSEYAFVNEDGELRFTDDSHTGYIHDQWAKWNIEVAEAAKYKFQANVNSSNGQNYRITLKNEAETSTLGTWYGPNNASGARKIATELVDLAIGNYVLMIEDTVNWSHGRVVNIIASYEGGNTVEVPGQILAKEAVIGIVENGHQKMSHLMGSGDLKYDDNGYNMEEFATWTLNVTKAGEMAVTLNVSHAGHMFSLELYQGKTRLDSIGEIISGDDKTVWDDGDITLPDHLTFPAVGTYTLKLLNNQAHSGGALHAISFARVPIVIDENATVNGNWAYCASDETIDLSIIRTFKGGMYNTICLPIELGSTNSMNAAFGAGYELLKLSGATLNGNELYITFESVETLEYGIPHLIKPVADVVNPSFTGRKIKTTTASTVTKGVVDFIGNFIVSEVPAGENNLFLGPDDLLYFSQTATPIKGMRAYFKVNVPGAANNIKAARIVKGTQVITELNLVGADSKAVKTIENGQLIITIDGVRYNVMGTKIQ